MLFNKTQNFTPPFLSKLSLVDDTYEMLFVNSLRALCDINTLSSMSFSITLNDVLLKEHSTGLRV